MKNFIFAILLLSFTLMSWAQNSNNRYNLIYHSIDDEHLELIFQDLDNKMGCKLEAKSIKITIPSKKRVGIIRIKTKNKMKCPNGSYAFANEGSIPLEIGEHLPQIIYGKYKIIIDHTFVDIINIVGSRGHETGNG